jgi:hypothetical protein
MNNKGENNIEHDESHGAGDIGESLYDMSEPPVIIKYKYDLRCNGNVNGKLDIIKAFAEIVRQKCRPPLPEMPENINKQDHESDGKNISHPPGS